MLMKDDKRNVISVIISKLRNKAEMAQEGPESAANQVADDSEKVMCCEEILAAIEAKDSQALCDALCAMIEMCDNDEESSPTDATEPGEFSSSDME